MSFRPEPPPTRRNADRRPRGPRAMALLALAAFSVIAACTDILGIPDRTYSGGTGGDGGGGAGGSVGCSKDADCLTSPYGKVCDTSSGTCVECLPGPNDACAFGLYCDTTRSCFLGCADDTDCNPGGAATPLTCNTATHQCEGCDGNTLCPPGSKCDENGVCVSGCDASPDCPTADWQCCTGQCKNTTKDIQNCGACDDPCAPADSTTWLCLDGGCVFQSCLPGFADCDQNLSEDNGCEVSTQTDVEHCGGCGKACNLPHAGAVCSGGTCEIGSCSAPYQDCDGMPGNGCEANTQTDAANCNGCGQSCDSTFPHATPACEAGACAFGGCQAGWGDCNGNEQDGCEVNLSTTVQHCGGCGDACDLPNATPACAAGKCVIASCAQGFDDCDNNPANGCEVNLNADPASCAACGAACTFPNGTGVCNGGVCELSACNPGFADCDGMAPNGCETSTLTNAEHCGGCGSVCGTQNAASAQCMNGTCQISCNAPYGDCDGLPSNGCETNTSANVNHCGSCGMACPSGGTPNCVNSTCGTSSCGADMADCDGNGSCETNITTPQNCGACGNTCSNNHATPACAGAPLQCQLACSSGWGDCNNNAADGCEQTLTTNLHCTACGTKCEAAHANTSCAGGTCQIVSCQPGYANCNGNPADGCEVQLATDVGHCGACNKPCDPAHANGQCTAGTCQIQQCDSGYLDCNNSANDGCEVNLQADVFNCGACGNTCSFPNAQPTCVAPGVCQMGACNLNFNNCDGSSSNGCEVNTQANLMHCGACNNACSTLNGTAMCSLGMCAINCNGGYDDCNNDVGDGCETSLHTLMDCGSCGALCNLPNASESCATGMCTFVGCNSTYNNCDQNPTNGCECGPNASCAGMMCQGGTGGTGGTGGSGGTGGTGGSTGTTTTGTGASGGTGGTGGSTGTTTTGTGASGGTGGTGGMTGTTTTGTGASGGAGGSGGSTDTTTGTMTETETGTMTAMGPKVCLPAKPWVQCGAIPCSSPDCCELNAMTLTCTMGTCVSPIFTCDEVTDCGLGSSCCAAPGGGSSCMMGGTCTPGFELCSVPTATPSCECWNSQADRCCAANPAAGKYFPYCAASCP